jgi:hypothetical protein
MKKINLHIGLLVSIVLGAALCRLLPHPLNVTPVGAMALFGGAYFTQRWQAFLIPLASLWLSDLVLNNIVYRAYFPQFTLISEGSAWIYGSFSLIVLLGWFLLKKVTVSRVIGVSLVSSTLFYLITNYSVWQFSTMYPKSTEGLMMCYTAALPFFLNSILGDLLWCGVLFGGYELAKKRYPSIALG